MKGVTRPAPSLGGEECVGVHCGGAQRRSDEVRGFY
jgi:hypothetical protein